MATGARENLQLYAQELYVHPRVFENFSELDLELPAGGWGAPVEMEWGRFADHDAVETEILRNQCMYKVFWSILHNTLSRNFFNPTSCMFHLDTFTVTDLGAVSADCSV
ncbi:hypothetical protein BaRGS_00002427 [Batillaria attramentaria]|uniref:Uncharacterized protein n=1 Tax=Batillaria attramentaria TaxID=370345 RepID=A0ABD0M350_9CAEN